MISLTINDEKFRIEFKEPSDVPFATVDLVRLDASSERWIGCTGKQWTASIEAQRGGRMEWVKDFINAVNEWLSEYFGEIPPEDMTELQKLEAFMKEHIAVNGSQLEYKQ